MSRDHNFRFQYQTARLVGAKGKKAIEYMESLIVVLPFPLTPDSLTPSFTLGVALTRPRQPQLLTTAPT